MTNDEDHYYDVYCKAAREYMETTGETTLPDYFVGSAEIEWKDRVLTQATMQKHVDTAISSTVNLPSNATKDDIANLYLTAWKSGCKGITIFRDGCKKLGILTTDNKNAEEKEPETNTINSETIVPRGVIIDCSEDLVGKKRKLITGCGSLHVLGFFDPVDGSLQEVYFNKGSTGGCANFMTGLSRTVSLLCRAGVDIHTIKDQLDSTGSCPSYAARRATHGDTSKGSCCPMAIGNALLDMWNEMQEEICSDIDDETTKLQKPIKVINKIKNPCPQCGEALRYEGGCVQCPSCGWSKCD